MRRSDDTEKPKNAPQVFPGFPIIKSARHCGKITIVLKNVRFMGTVSGPAGYLSMCICLLTKALMHDACRIWRRGECTDLFNIVCVWFRILCFRVNPWPLFMFASVDL